MAAERHVGSVNYNLSVYGPVLGLASSSIVKSKAMDLIELKPFKEAIKYRSLSTKVNKLIESWKMEQEKVGLCKIFFQSILSCWIT